MILPKIRLLALYLNIVTDLLYRVTFKTKLKCGFERNPVKVELVVPLYKEPLFLGYVVVTPVENWLLGYRAAYNLDDKGFDKHAFCLGYNNGRTEVGLKL